MSCDHLDKLILKRKTSLMQMRRSRVLKKLRAGDTAFSFGSCMGSSRIVEIAAMSGFDCIWVENEHCGTDWSVIEQQIQVAKIYDVDTMVRVPRGSYSDYIKAFELDAAGIIVPHITSLEDAKNVVNITRFHPIGKRCIDGGYADACYGAVSTKDYIREANKERFIIVEIEDYHVMDDLDAICALEGIDAIMVGPGDYSHSLGIPGETAHPKVVDAQKRVLEAALAHGKHAFALNGNPENIHRLIDMGYRLFHLGADTVAIRQFCQNVIQKCQPT